MPVAYTLDPVLGYVPAIPEPFWYKSWRTLFRYRPACYRCKCVMFLDGDMPTLFKNRAEWDAHYVLTHLEEDLRRDNEGHQD